MAPENNKWALLIGIDRYHESLGSLKYAGADCRVLRDTLVSGPLGFPEDQVLLLDDSAEADRRPTFANIHSFLGSWLAAPKEADIVLVYFAGHGRLVDGKTYLVPGDATLSSIHTLGIPLRNVQDLLERCKAKRKLLVLDACHSGSGRDVAAMPGGMADALAEGAGFYTISSCGAEECSHEWDEKGHGVFSHFLTEALRGGCSPSADGRLTVDRLYEWVHDRVAKWAAQHRCSQTPQRFAKGAGSVVLMQSIPNHAALAEQYRRELEELKARLAEIDLRDARRRLAEKQSMAPAGPNASPVRCVVPEWREWLLSRRRKEEIAYNWFSIITLILGLLIPASFAMMIPASPNEAFSPGNLWLVGCVGLFMFLWLAAWRHIYRNKYLLECAQFCVKGRDYIQGSDLVFRMGRLGVDSSASAHAVVSLAEVAEADGDFEQAHLLYRHAASYWKSPHARHALGRLDSKSDRLGRS